MENIPKEIWPVRNPQHSYKIQLQEEIVDTLKKILAHLDSRWES